MKKDNVKFVREFAGKHLIDLRAGILFEHLAMSLHLDCWAIILFLLRPHAPQLAENPAKDRARSPGLCPSQAGASAAQGMA